MTSQKTKSHGKLRDKKTISFDLSARASAATKKGSYPASANPSTREMRSFRSGSSQKSKMSVRLSNLMAAMYPGIKVGHKNCVDKIMLVPSTMGWLWNTEDTVAGVPFPRGWRPGAIALGVKKRSFRIRSFSEPMTTPIGAKIKKMKKKVKTAESSIIKLRTQSAESDTVIKVPPTLRVQKEGGVYRLTMQPIRHTPGQKTEDEQPVQFKIADDNSESKIFDGSSGGSSSLKIEYMATGALRKPVVKPELTEMGTQWDTTDFQKKEVKKVEEIPEAPKDEKKKKKKKKSVKQETVDEGVLNQNNINSEDAKLNNDVKDKPVKN